MLEKIKASMPMLTSQDFIWIFAAIVAYHLFLFMILYLLFVVPARSKTEKMADSLFDEKKRMGSSWKDREEELRLILLAEKEREINQMKAEYDSYVKLLEQKLMRSRTKDAS